jgi:hypothetical protein
MMSPMSAGRSTWFAGVVGAAVLLLPSSLMAQGHDVAEPGHGLAPGEPKWVQEAPSGPEESLPGPLQELVQSVALSQRPLTLPRGALRPDVGFDVRRFVVFSPVHIIGITAGAGFGVTDDLEVGGTLVPLYIDPEGDVGDRAYFGNMTLHGMYRFVRGDVEVAARLDVQVPTASDSDGRNAGLAFGLPVLLRAGRHVRIDTGVQLALLFRSDTRFGSRVTSSLGALWEMHERPLATRSISGIPLIVNVMAGDQAYFGLRTGVGILVLDEPNLSTVMPLGFHAGGTVPSPRGPLVDLTARFEWPYFASNAFVGDAITTSWWQVTFAASFYLYLL